MYWTNTNKNLPTTKLKVPRFKGNQFVYDPTQETFSNLLKTPKKIPTPALTDQANEFMGTLVFGKLPVQTQHELSTEGK